MIHLTRLNRLPLVLNADLIEWIEVTPDTVISLTTGQKLVVRESPDEVVERVLDFRRAICAGLPSCPLATGAGATVAGALNADPDRIDHGTPSD